MVEKLIIAAAILAVLALAAFLAIDRYIYRYGLHLNLKLLAGVATVVIVLGAFAWLTSRSRQGRR